MSGKVVSLASRRPPVLTPEHTAALVCATAMLVQIRRELGETAEGAYTLRALVQAAAAELEAADIIEQLGDRIAPSSLERIREHVRPFVADVSGKSAKIVHGEHNAG